ncbi:MAG TPA: aldehyde dehydrogenase family protein [Magnetospirillaceae bacterium]|nr:aldehyde dehydrogenase family protein [Magnetospirillaceae bacterium]
MRMLIDSRWVDAENGATRKVINPADGSVIDTVPQATEKDVSAAVDSALEAKVRMSAMPAWRRAAVLCGCADQLELRKEELAGLLARENGKPIRQTREEVAAAARIFRGFAEESKRLFGKSMSLDMVPGMERHFAFTMRRPAGVVAAIVPFNYPVELYAHKAAAALAAGNAVIVKPPSDCPLTILKIAEILEQAGLPRGAHQTITGSGTVVGEFLARTPGVNIVSITGSTIVGKRISLIASETLKRVHLELGGNDATIVCKDADIERAAESVILGRLARGNGQICCAVKRVFVDEGIYEEFLRVLVAKTKNLKMGNPLDEETDVGPLINESAAIDVEKSIRQAVGAGAMISIGGGRNGAFIEPTVLRNVSHTSPIMQEEIFGPVAPVVPFRSLEEAVSWANDSEYGLQSSVFTNDLKTAMDVAYRLEVGGVIINWSSAVRAENLPFGGIKLSGHGRESIHDTLLDMTDQKSVILYDALSVYSDPGRQSR